MVTHRSRNKLERKAHMNIHDTIEVVDEVHKDAKYTRDRFGKKHEVSNTGQRAVDFGVKKTLAVFFVFILAQAVPTFADAGSLSSKKNTNIVVDTQELGLISLNEKIEPEEKFAIPIDEATDLGFNEDGDPALKRQF